LLRRGRALLGHAPQVVPGVGERPGNGGVPDAHHRDHRLEAQRAQVEAMQKAMGRIIPWVFVQPNGRPAREFRVAWRSACRRAGVPGKLFHDFRRTAVRNMLRAGIPGEVAMKLAGHRTRAILARYAIVDEGMMREAADKLDALRARAEVRRIGPNVRRDAGPTA
jgi:integrase